MQLREFIKASLLDVMGGIKDAQSEWHASTQGNGAINPAWGGVDEKHAREVAFDIAVTVEAGSEGKGSAGIKVWGLGVDGALSDTKKNSSVSRIQFAVSYIAPVIEIERTAWSSTLSVPHKVV